MIVKIPKQRQFPESGGTQQRFDDLAKYLLDNFGLEATTEFLRTRHFDESNHNVVMPGFTDILNYAAGDRLPVAISPKDLSGTAYSTAERSTEDRFTVDTSTADRPTNDPLTDDHSTTAPSPDKCVAVEVHGVAHFATAIAEMNAVAAKNARVKDPAYHFLLSWPEHEKPAHADIFDAARHALRALNFHEHQYMLAIHVNTDNIHCHIAVNRVHPVTFKSQHLPYAKRTLHRAARESEIKHSWFHDNGIYIVEIGEDGEKRIVKNSLIDVHANEAYDTDNSTTDALTTENTPAERSKPATSPNVRPPTASPWTDPDSLINWARTTIAPKLQTALPTFSTWQDLHQFLSQWHVSIADTGGGGMRLRAIEADTGEVLDIPVSKALRLLKRADLESRWGAFQPPTAPLTESPRRSSTNGKTFDDIGAFDRFDRFAPHPEIAGRRSSLSNLPGGHVATSAVDPALLLPRDAPDHMGHDQADLDPGVRRGSDARRRIEALRAVASKADDSGTENHTTDTSRNATSKPGASKPAPHPADPFAFGHSKPAKPPKRDPLARALRKEERTAERIALRRSYQQYREAIAKTNLAHDARKSALLTQQREERRQQRDTFYNAKGLLNSTHRTQPSNPTQRGDAALLPIPSTADHSLTASLLAHNHAIAKLTLASYHKDQLRELSLIRLPALAWRDWLHEEAQLGNSPALSALRGLVYQARRDAKSTADRSPDDPSTTDHSTTDRSLADRSPAGVSNIAHSPIAPFKTDPSTTATSTTDDSDTAAYLLFISKLREDELRERAIRSANADQARPYQCDALLVQAAHMSYRVTGNGNVQYFDVREAHLFTDRGNRLTFDRKLVTDDELRLALLHAREKFGNKLTLTGEDPVFTARMARMADDLGIGILNPELRSTIDAHRADKQRAQMPTPQITSAPTSTQQTAPASAPSALTPTKATPTPKPTPKEITPPSHTPEMSASQPTPTETPAPQPSTTQPRTPETQTPQRTSTPALESPTAPLTTATSIERLRQTILATHPRATFLTVNQRNKTPYIGTIVAQDTDTFAQRVGRNTFAIHSASGPAGMPPLSKTSVQVTYQNGHPICTVAPRKSRAKEGR